MHVMQSTVDTKGSKTQPTPEEAPSLEELGGKALTQKGTVKLGLEGLDFIKPRKSRGVRN